MSLLQNLSASCFSKNIFFRILLFILFLTESFNEHFSKYKFLQIICPPPKKKKNFLPKKSRSIGYLISINSN